MNYAIIIPSKNTDNLLACVASILSHEPNSTPDIYVIDDGLHWPALPGGLWVIEGEKPFIFSRACNTGIEICAPADVILCNDDALLATPKGFTALSRCAAEHPEYGIIGAVTNVTGQPLQQPQRVGLREVPYFAFVCVYIPRRTIEKIGMLDERYCIDYGMEDRSYCEACTRAGLKVGVYDFCYVDHGSLVSTYRGDPRKPASYKENLKIFNQIWGTDLKC